MESPELSGTQKDNSRECVITTERSCSAGLWPARWGGRDVYPTAGGTPALQGGTAPNGSAGVPPAVSGASRPRFGDVKNHDRGRLPHWEKESATYFITFRLDDSLPKSVLERIESERESLVKTAKQLQRELSSSERTKIKQLSTKTIEQYWTMGLGPAT